MHERMARFLTAEGFLALLEMMGVARGAAAERLGISRASLYQWPKPEEAEVSPAGAPSDEQLAALVGAVTERFEELHAALRDVLERENVRARERRDLLRQMRPVVDTTHDTLQALDEQWQNLEAEMNKLLERFGRSAIDILAASTSFAPTPSPKQPAPSGAGERPAREAVGSALPESLMRQTFAHKYEAVFAVLMAASVQAHPADLAAQVRELFPRGTFLPYRICEDIGHILRADGVYADIGSRLTAAQRHHLEAMKAHMQRRGWWGRK